MPPNESNDSGGMNSFFVTVIGGAMALITTLILASYAYTWAESSKNVDEKTQWRKEHQQVLDKKFEELTKTQERLAEKIEQSNDRTRDLLQQVLEEQRKYNDRVGHGNNPSQRR